MGAIDRKCNRMAVAPIEQIVEELHMLEKAAVGTDIERLLSATSSEADAMKVI